jgi:hypothetical protein
MDENSGYALVPCIRYGMLEQSGSITPATCMGKNRNTKFGTCDVDVFNGKGEVSHSNQQQTAVIDARDLVTLKVERRYILLNVLVFRATTEAQIAITRVQGQEMAGNPISMVRAQGSNREHCREHLVCDSSYFHDSPAPRRIAWSAD